MRTLIAAAAAIGLAGCTTTLQDIDASIQKSLPQICSGSLTIHTTFLAVAATGAVPEKAILREAQAWSVLEPLCADPANATSTTVLVTAANAYIVIAQALREAKA